MQITFSPHTKPDATKILDGISDRINQETHSAKGNVIFAVMQIAGASGSVLDTLGKLHATQSVYSYGISDAPTGIFLYAPGKATGVQVTGKPSNVILPPPFDQVPSLPGHEIHDKFVICGLNGNDPVVYCGSSNLAAGGEAANGDNLLAIHDADVAAAFAIEALGLVDHYSFLDRMAHPKPKASDKAGPAGPRKKAQPGAKKTGHKVTKEAAAKKKTATKRSTKRKTGKGRAGRP
jgi:hypothetical protein